MELEYFTIEVLMKNGEVFKIRRYTQAGVTDCLEQYYPLSGYAEGVEKVRVYKGEFPEYVGKFE